MRVAAVSALSAALVVTGATAASAAPAPVPAPKPVITIKASKTGIKLGDVVTFTGRTAGLKEGSKVTLQVKAGDKWLTLPQSAPVVKSAYKIADKFTKKGAQVLRAKDGNTVSAEVLIRVA
ncbi:hypothetical protein [Streptomyces sp. 4F14]|uniref:hypothetical protein n=1 Tax=Streptomyces sp. 4F14 TaxID=3394380 RepID=UPI003A8C23C0